MQLRSNGLNPNPYLSEVESALPRLLAQFDTDETGPSHGQGNRYHWAWKLIDFGNGTFQGAAHGLARLIANGLLPGYLSEQSISRRIGGMFTGAAALRRPNGSMEEAFPHESSFCVTALVAYDLLTAIELLDSRLDPARREYYLSVVRPMISFLHDAKETHAFISNHLATAAVALYKWSALSKEAGEARGKEILDQLLKGQHDEGWFREYEGADPGYQTLCTYYLTDLHRLRPDLNLLKPLHRSIQFLWHFAHPDGSFGGLYGSRNTRLYFPSGIEYLANEIPEAGVLATFMRDSIKNQTTVTLAAMDEPNLIPMFNAYCWAAAIRHGEMEGNRERPESVGLELPALSSTPYRKVFKGGGLVVDRGPDRYTVISWHKGGVCHHFQDGKTYIDAGIVARDQKGRLYSTQTYQANSKITLDKGKIAIDSHLVLLRKKLPSPYQFILLRILNLTLMRSTVIRNWIKKRLVRYLITGKTMTKVQNRRTISLDEKFNVTDEWIGHSNGFKRIDLKSPFAAIHMASQGYWQKQDDSS